MALSHKNKIKGMEKEEEGREGKGGEVKVKVMKKKEGNNRIYEVGETKGEGRRK